MNTSQASPAGSTPAGLNLLAELKPDMRAMIAAAQKVAIYDATIAASFATAEPITPTPHAQAERDRDEALYISLRTKWGI